MSYVDWRTRKIMQRQPMQTGGFVRGRYTLRQGDGLFSAIAGVGKAILKAVVPKNTIVGKMLAGPAGTSVAKLGIPTAPFSYGSALAGIGAGLAATAATSDQAKGLGSLIPWWKGAGGHLQFPWQDPSFMEGLKPPFVLDDSYLKEIRRAPRGYVVVRDNKGRPYCMAKFIAQKLHAWTPARKPPISAGEWHKYQTAAAVEKKLRHIAGKALRKHARGGGGRGGSQRFIIQESGPGSVKVSNRRAA